MSQDLAVWTIYFNPKDHPGRYVTRKFLIVDGRAVPDEAGIVAKDLSMARAAVPGGCVRIPRLRGDDPVIVETWV